MTREYISWLGLFTTVKDGIFLLRKFKIYDHLYHLADQTGLNDSFCQIIIHSFDYRFEEEPRTLLGMWLNKCSPYLSKEIIEILRTLYRSGLNDFA